MPNEIRTRPLLQRELVHEIVGCAYEVLNTLGHGLNEKPYENALATEFRLRGIPFVQQPRFPVEYKGVVIAEYIPDLIVADVVVVEAKVIEKITDMERGQLINYLRITKIRTGLLVNFKHPRLEWARMVL